MLGRLATPVLRSRDLPIASEPPPAIGRRPKIWKAKRTYLVFPTRIRGYFQQALADTSSHRNLSPQFHRCTRRAHREWKKYKAL